MKFKDLSEQRFGRLVAKTYLGDSKWYCVCDCGGSSKSDSYQLSSGKTQSCGCLQKERASVANTTHGATIGRKLSAEYRCWQELMRRCYNKNCDAYKDYGGRGITICDRWKQSFENFYADMGTKPSSKHSIERKNVNGNYEPSNCCWATAKEQGLNKRNSLIFTSEGKTLHIKKWAELTGVNYYTLKNRYHAGEPIESMLTRKTGQKKQ